MASEAVRAPTPQDLRERVAIVTGGASGIGSATAALLAVRGAQVVLGDLDVRGAGVVVDDIVRAGGRASAVELDVTDPACVERTFDRVREEVGAATVLINAAGGSLDADGPVDRLDADVFDETVRVDLRGTMLCCRSAIAHMRPAGGGSIVNLSSFHAIAGDSPAHAYTAAKGGVDAITRAIAARYACDRIRVNSIAPGIVTSRRIRERIARDGVDLDAVTSTHPFAVGEPDDVARIAVFLASDDSRLITGTTIAADGGLSTF